MMVFMPESPVLLVAKGKYDQAKRALQFYWGEDFEVEEDIKDIENYLNCNAGNFLNNIKDVAALNSCGILTALFILIEMSSIGTTFIYEDMIYVSGDLYGIKRTGCTIISMSMIQIGIIIAACLIDTVGRRKLLMISTGLTSLIMGLLGLYYLVLAFDEIFARNFEYLVVWILYLSKISYGVGAAPIIYCLVGELPTSGAKNIILAVVFSVFWMSTYASLYVYPLVVDHIGEGAVVLLTSCFYGIAFIIVFLFLVETKHKTLFEIQIELKKKLQETHMEESN